MLQKNWISLANLLDRSSKVLYLYPHDNETARYKLAVSTFDLISVSGASHIVFEGLVIEGGRGNGIVMNNSQHITLKDNEVRHLSMNAIDLDGSEHQVIDNHIHTIGGVGVALDGGSYPKVSGKTLNNFPIEKTNNLVKGNVIHDFAWDQKSQIPGISFRGFGHTAVENEISMLLTLLF